MSTAQKSQSPHHSAESFSKMKNPLLAQEHMKKSQTREPKPSEFQKFYYRHEYKISYFKKLRENHILYE